MLREHDRRGVERFYGPEDKEVCCQIVSPRNVREASLLMPQQHGCLHKPWTRTAVDRDTNDPAMMEVGRSPGN